MFHSKFQSLVQKKKKTKLSQSSRLMLPTLRDLLSRCMKGAPCFLCLCCAHCTLLTVTTERLNYVGFGALYYRQLELRTRDTKVTLAPLWLAGRKRPCRRAAQWQRNRDLHTTPAKQTWERKSLWKENSPSAQEASLGLRFLLCNPLSRMKKRKKKKQKEKIPHLLLTYIMIRGENASACEPALALPLADPQCTC